MTKKQKNKKRQKKNNNFNFILKQFKANGSQNRSNVTEGNKVPQTRQKKPKIQQPKNDKKHLYQQVEEQQQSRQKQVHICSKQKRKISKNSKSKSKQLLINQTKIKLKRGYKFCQNCQTVLNIHKYVCTQCGFVHNMKKHKFDVMKNLAKGTPKIVKALIQADQFNIIKVNQARNQVFPASFSFSQDKLKSVNNNQKANLQAANQQQLPMLQVKSDQQLKRNKSKNKSQNNQEIKQARTVDKQNIRNEKGLNTINFQPLFIKNAQNFSAEDKPSLLQRSNSVLQRSKLEGQTKSKQKMYNKDDTREQFSSYQSQLAITNLQTIQIQAGKCQTDNVQAKCQQFLLFTQSVSKRQIYECDIQVQSYPGAQQRKLSLSPDNQQILDQIGPNQKNLMNTNKQLQRKKQEQRQKIRKLRQNDALTQKAFGLGKYHRIGAKYDGESVINLMNINDQTGMLQENQHLLKRIRIDQHIESVKAIGNKVALLTGRKHILLMNLDVQHEQEKPKQRNMQNERQKSKRKVNSERKVNNEGKVTQKTGQSLLKLTKQDFSSNSTNLNLHFLTKISLSQPSIQLPSSQINNQQDHFTVMEWLKLLNNSENRSVANQQPSPLSYLVCGTLFGHIIVYKISYDNSFYIYRAIVGAHFEMINCLKQCPLSQLNRGIFASAGYDGSVKIWDMQQKQSICSFQVSNRKVQQLHWDSGAKFLIIVRDQGLENCYLACFYSISNRVQLPIMLANTIDFRLIRNQGLFENSCSPLISYPLNSKLIIMLNSRNGIMKIIQAQQLRKTSLKRKKSKKNSQQQIYHDFWLRILKNDQRMQVKQQANKTTDQKVQVVKMMSNINGFSKPNYAQYLDEQQVDNKAKYESKVIIDGQQQNEISNQLQSIRVTIQNGNKRPSNKRQQQSTKHLNSHPSSSRNTSHHLPSSTLQQGTRKSLRLRKPNIQYNYIIQPQDQQREELQQQSQSQQAHKNKKVNKSKLINKNKQAKIKKGTPRMNQSDQQEQQDGDDDFCQQQQEQQQSEQVVQSEYNFDDANSKSKNDHTVRNKSEKDIGINDNGKQSKKNVNKNTKNKSKSNDTNNLNNQSPKTHHQSNLLSLTKNQLNLYTIFCQQTTQQQLSLNRQQYPANKFPKFSSIASFVCRDERQKVNVNDNLINGQQIKAGHNNNNESMDIVKKDKGLTLKQKQQYLTTFIAGYDGQLIKVRIKVDDQQDLGVKDQQGQTQKQIKYAVIRQNTKKNEGIKRNNISKKKMKLENSQQWEQGEMQQQQKQDGQSD